MVKVHSSDEIVAELGFELENLEREEVRINGQKYDFFNITGEPTAGPVGWPRLPTIVRFVLIPPQSGVELKVHNLTSQIVPEINPFPIQPLDSDDYSQTAMSDPTEYGSEVFVNINNDFKNDVGSDGFWPPEVARVGKPAIMRGYRLIPVVIHPLRYNPQTHELEIIESIDFELDFTTELNAVNLVQNPNRPRPSRFVDKVIRNLVLNPPPQRDVPPTGGSIMYVIGNWDNIEEELEPLVEWRRRMGWTVELVRVAQGNTAAIKNAIQEAYDDWDVPLEHVVIVGDTDGQYPRACYDVHNRGNWPYESDHQYIELEGDDVLPEASIGRLILDSPNMLRGIVNKTILYESDPFIGENVDQRGWQKRAAFVSGSSQSGLSSIDCCRWTKDLVLRQGFEDVAEMYWSPQTPELHAQQFIISNINAGISVFLYRGWTYMSHFTFDDVDGLRNGRMLPFVILATCNTGDYGEHVSSFFYYTERFNYHPNGGAIGAVGSAGATHTAYNNLISASIFKAFLADGIYSQGWALMQGKIDLYRHYSERGDIPHEEQNGMDAWLCELYIFNLMGDPAVDLFTDVPHELTVNSPEEIRIGESNFELTVEYAEDETPVEDALVCLYKPEVFQLVTRTGEDGHVLFNFNPEWTQDGEIQLTVTGHNLLSVLVDYEIAEANMFLANGGLEIDDDEEGESRGDGDGTANPTERLELIVQITNFGAERPEGELQVSLTPGAPHVEVIIGEANLDEAPEPGESSVVPFVVEIGGGFPNNENAAFNLEVTAGEETWQSVVLIPVEGSEIAFEAMAWVEDPLRSGDIADISITVRNVGTRSTQGLLATLIPLTRTIGVVEEQGVFQAMEPNQTSDEAYRISAHPLHIGGAIAEFLIAFESEDGFQDTAYFSFPVDRPRDGEPFGGDSYGYICFDNTDVDWFMAPEFDWIEIDTGQGGQGQNTGLRDRSEQNDASTLIDLPFTFVYYGEEFNEVTICTNGWIALGDHHELITARNRRIPAGMVGSSMICPFWEDLITTGDGGIFTWLDAENHIFVVEWSNMRKLGPEGVNEPIETFEVILYDPEFHPSFTGDGDIKFQYLEITDDQSCFQRWDTPFATVGIGSPDQTTGLEYTYWGELHDGAAPLDSARVILFSTLIDFVTGAMEGLVVDAVSEVPIEGVTITTTYGFSATTNDTGYYIIPDMLVDTTITYEVTANKEFYNDSTITDLRLVADSTLVVNFGLLHPEFRLNFNGVDVVLENENANDFEIPLVNTGSGPLQFTSMIQFRDIERDEMWDTFLDLDVTNAPVGVNDEGDTLLVNNKSINGVIFVDSLFYIAGGGNEIGEQLYAEIYRFTRNGEFVDSIAQPWIDRRGLRGMAYDGSDIIYGVFEDHIYIFDKEMNVLDTMEAHTSIGIDIAYNLTDSILYVTGTTDYVYALDLDGNVIKRWRPEYEGTRLRKYGLSWYPGQPDSLNLLIFCKYGDDPVLFGCNPVSEETQLFTVLRGDEDDNPAGIDVTDRWNSSVWTLSAVFNNRNADRMMVFELDPNTTWLSYSPVEGVLQAGQDTTFHIRVEAGLKPLDRYWVVLRYEHDADPGFMEIPIVMQIVGEGEAGLSDNAQTPDEFNLEQNWPNPFNPATTLKYTLPEAGHVRLTVYDTMGRLVDLLQDGRQKSGGHEVIFNAEKLPNGIYIYQLEANGLIATRKMVLLK